jgi:chromosome segregation ATPase
LALGPLYLKSFKEKIQALDEALSALQGRVSTLRDGAIVKTEKVVERIETMVNKVGKTGDIVDSTTEATLHRVHSLHSEVKDLNLSADRTGLKVSSIVEGMETLTKSHGEAHVKIDHLNDLQQAKEEAKRAMEMVLEQTTKTSECKLDGFNSCDMKCNIDSD